MRSGIAAGLCLFAVIGCSCVAPPERGPSMESLMKIAGDDPKPFVVIGGGQGVVISSDGLVLTAAHVTFDKEETGHKDEVEVSFRKRVSGPWPGAVKRHATKVVDAGPTAFFEETYKAGVIKKDGKAMIGGKDLGVLKIETTAELPHVEFYSREKPEIKIGDRLYMCHFVFPTSAAEPTFLVSPLTVIGAARTTMGVQYLAKGFFRWGYERRRHPQGRQAHRHPVQRLHRQHEVRGRNPPRPCLVRARLREARRGVDTEKLDEFEQQGAARDGVGALFRRREALSSVTAAAAT